MARRRAGLAAGSARTPLLEPGRRRWLGRACASACACAGPGWLLAGAAEAAIDDGWRRPDRFQRPAVETDEGGLWALMDREERRLRRSPFVLREVPLAAYLTDITCRLAGTHCPDARVYAVRSPWFNASMAPNGMMQVWTGLLLRMDNEAQLAAVIGHEIGHYLQRHSIERLRDAQARTAFMGLLAFAGVVGLIGQMAVLAGAMSYSREHESDADRIGVILMREAGYDPREAAKVWENLRQELSAGKGGDPAKKSVLFATHPAPDDRQAKLAQWSGDGGGETGEAAYARQLEPWLMELLEDELRRGQYDETLALVGRLSARQPRRPEFLHARGEALRLRNQGDDRAAAREAYEAALALEQPPPVTHRALGLLLRDEGRRPEARTQLERYLALAPQAPDASLIRSYLAEP